MKIQILMFFLRNNELAALVGITLPEGKTGKAIENIYVRFT